MALWQHLPTGMILLCLLSAAACSLLRGRAARCWLCALAGVETLLSVLLLVRVTAADAFFVYRMGEVGAPFGNELRVGPAEAVMGLLFSAVMLFSVLGGWRQVGRDIIPHRQNLFCAVCCLLFTALLAMTYTNDLFTGYVFIEILTLSACALIASGGRGRALFAATRYMIFNLVGSGLFLLGLCMVYCLTGELLFPQLAQKVALLTQEGAYGTPLHLAVLLMALGLGIKSALYPFHSWLPNAYASATPSASAMLSSLISKAYIFLLIKILWRMAGPSLMVHSGIAAVLFGYSCVGVVMGSVEAIWEHGVKRMVAWSSVSQIGYIFLGLSLGTQAGMAAALFQILAHSCAKAMLFLSADRLCAVSGNSQLFRDLRGSGYRAPLAGVAFSVGAMSLCGVPLLAGFAGKLFLCEAALEASGWKMVTALITLALSTLLNVLYMMRTVLTLYRRSDRQQMHWDPQNRPGAGFVVSMVCLIAAVVGLCLFAQPVMECLVRGVQLFN